MAISLHKTWHISSIQSFRDQKASHRWQKLTGISKRFIFPMQIIASTYFHTVAWPYRFRWPDCGIVEWILWIPAKSHYRTSLIDHRLSIIEIHASGGCNPQTPKQSSRLLTLFSFVGTRYTMDVVTEVQTSNVTEVRWVIKECLGNIHALTESKKGVMPKLFTCFFRILFELRFIEQFTILPNRISEVMDEFQSPFCHTWLFLIKQFDLDSFPSWTSPSIFVLNNYSV